jgi:hypothetical protein
MVDDRSMIHKLIIERTELSQQSYPHYIMSHCDYDSVIFATSKLLFIYKKIIIGYLLFSLKCFHS